MKEVPLLTYESLSDIEKVLICNGCGGKGGKVKVPSFLFLANCNKHDFSYWQGGNSGDRRKADYGFYRAMRQDAGYNLFYQAVAMAYFIAVRLCGHQYFQYRSSKKTREDLDIEIAQQINNLLDC